MKPRHERIVTNPTEAKNVKRLAAAHAVGEFIRKASQVTQQEGAPMDAVQAWRKDHEAHLRSLGLTFKAGDKVKAFHPAMVGVVKYGDVVSIGRTYARIDFGQLLGGTWKVRREDILGLDGND